MASVAGAVQVMALAADVQAAQASQLLRTNRSDLALAHAESALRWNPYQIKAAYTQWVALKGLGRWAALSDAAGKATAWHPEQAALLRLHAEALNARGESPERIATLLWRAFTLDPAPQLSAGQLWRMTMAASAKAWGDSDSRTAAAALKAAELAPGDTMISDKVREATMREALATLRRAGAPQTALKLEARAKEVQQPSAGTTPQ